MVGEPGVKDPPSSSKVEPCCWLDWGVIRDVVSGATLSRDEVFWIIDIFFDYQREIVEVLWMCLSSYGAWG